MANEQTSVPLFVADTILTAAQQNISAGTGVPVFATTVTRDAAFGGASEKVLAEGQLCYLSASNIVQYYDGAAWATVGPAAASAVSAVDISRVNTGETTSSSSYVGLTTAQTVTMTTGTKALVILAYNANPASSVETYASVAVSGATTVAAADARNANVQSTISGGFTQGIANAFTVTLTAGSNTFTMQFKTDGSSATFKNRSMTVIAYS